MITLSRKLKILAVGGAAWYLSDSDRRSELLSKVLRRDSSNRQEQAQNPIAERRLSGRAHGESTGFTIERSGVSESHDLPSWQKILASRLVLAVQQHKPGPSPPGGEKDTPKNGVPAAHAEDDDDDDDDEEDEEEEEGEEDEEENDEEGPHEPNAPPLEAYDDVDTDIDDDYDNVFDFPRFENNPGASGPPVDRPPGTGISPKRESSSDELSSLDDESQGRAAKAGDAEAAGPSDTSASPPARRVSFKDPAPEQTVPAHLRRPLLVGGHAGAGSSSEPQRSPESKGKESTSKVEKEEE
ncbi:histone H3.v1 [Galendromus occidentalis]|uniref:Histone H3.v1 n=1 Tax=Galendromus occidentalis TaxID=34638 RepID=A0AAJ6QP83_9ACAR|nr:histone H3.v1 [Galendromus occidentalis]